jgi:hypothetical protein
MLDPFFKWNDLLRENPMQYIPIPLYISPMPQTREYTPTITWVYTRTFKDMEEEERRNVTVIDSFLQ